MQGLTTQELNQIILLLIYTRLVVAIFLLILGFLNQFGTLMKEPRWRLLSQLIILLLLIVLIMSFVTDLTYLYQYSISFTPLN